MLCYNLAMPYQETRDLTSYISAYAPFVGVLVAIGVALMQFYLQREQAKQSLFDRRFTVYTAVERYLDSLVGSPQDGKQEDAEEAASESAAAVSERRRSSSVRRCG